ncbi:MAG: T9SS type A sorting domain-containing protein [Sphingobacteriaceae bacterium]|nr:MAG: T9SS type A sorting domain-containing protein [Sphingobacteriaceae bacterium]
MKKLLLKPGIECIFAFSLVAIIGLPPLVFGQDTKQTIKKEAEIKITDSDTIVNGKNIKNLTGKAHEKAVSQLASPRTFTFSIGEPHNTSPVMKYRKDGEHGIGIAVPGEFRTFSYDEPEDRPEDHPPVDRERFRAVPELGLSIGDEPRPGKRAFSLRRPFMAGSTNSQSFNYSSTDDEGISTHVSYIAGDASKEKLSEIAGVEKAGLELKDLNLSPEFSTGKTKLSFKLPVNAALDIQFKDSQGKVLWAEKTSIKNDAAYSKTFNLGLNGVYYLQVKQGNATALKRIVKED